MLKKKALMPEWLSTFLEWHCTEIGYNGLHVASGIVSMRKPA